MLVVADGAPGLIKAVEQCWPASDRQHCSVHRARNLIAKLPEQERERVRRAYWQALDEAKDERDATERLEALVAELERAGYRLGRAMPRPTISTRSSSTCATRCATASAGAATNLLERTLGEVKRRTKVIGRFPGEESCLSLVWAVLDLQINNACNGVKLSDIDRHKLYRLHHQPDESEAEREEVAAA